MCPLSKGSLLAWWLTIDFQWSIWFLNDKASACILTWIHNSARVGWWIWQTVCDVFKPSIKIIIWIKSIHSLHYFPFNQSFKFAAMLYCNNSLYNFYQWFWLVFIFIPLLPGDDWHSIIFFREGTWLAIQHWMTFVFLVSLTNDKQKEESLTIYHAHCCSYCCMSCITFYRNGITLS